MFFRTRFPHGVCVFFETATLTIVWFLQYETYFFIFRLRAFFSKKMQKNDPKPQYEKSLEKRPSGDLFWSPKSIKIDVGAAGNRKNLRKMTKNEVPIFMQIFACKKNAKKRKKNEKTVPPAECAGPAGGKEGSKPSGVCETFCITLHAILLHAIKFIQ